MQFFCAFRLRVSMYISLPLTEFVPYTQLPGIFMVYFVCCFSPDFCNSYKAKWSMRVVFFFFFFLVVVVVSFLICCVLIPLLSYFCFIFFFSFVFHFNRISLQIENWVLVFPFNSCCSNIREQFVFCFSLFVSLFIWVYFQCFVRFRC